MASNSLVLISVLVTFCWCDKTLTKTNSRRKEIIWLTHPDHKPSLWEVGGGAQAEAKVETMEERCLLVCFSGSLSYFSSPVQGCLPSNSNAHSRLGPTILSTNYKMAPPVGLMEAICQLRILLPWWFQTDKTSQHSCDVFGKNRTICMLIETSMVFSNHDKF